jgi:hypothetical protein
MLAPGIAVVTAIWLVAVCSRAGGSDRSLRPASDQPSKVPAESPGASGTIQLPASIIDPVIAEIARDAGVPIDRVRVILAEAVTFADGALGCPVPGIAYPQVQVDGFKIVADAGGTTYDYRGSGGTIRRCMTGG